MKIAIYAPYWHICGGGEKYLGQVAEILSHDNDVSFIALDNPDLAQLESRLHLDLSRVTVDHIHRPLFLRGLRQFRRLTRLVDLYDSWQVSRRTRDYDLFINQDSMDLIRSLSRRSAVICQAPPVMSALSDNLLTRRLFDPRCKTYGTILVYSEFTKVWAEKYYQREALVLHPPIDTASFVVSEKENTILSVGRFCTTLHCKKQLETVRAFKQLYATGNLGNWEYHLVGGVNHQAYLEQCKKEAEGYPILFHPDASFLTLKELYGKAKIFWHATGLGENEDAHPERMEHFGMTTVEAMSAGCVPVVINKGGQPEIVQDGINGFLFETAEDLVAHTTTLVNDSTLWQKMSEASIARSREFSLAEFEKRLHYILGQQGISADK
ncbi:MAG: glycosyltransferase family 4 protein [Dehalococcoidia bacterium]|nr:glycosyltransferase family 4 protein [Dehalococcoidia bacterium]